MRRRKCTSRCQDTSVYAEIIRYHYLLNLKMYFLFWVQFIYEIYTKHKYIIFINPAFSKNCYINSKEKKIHFYNSLKCLTRSGVQATSFRRPSHILHTIVRVTSKHSSFIFFKNVPWCSVVLKYFSKIRPRYNIKF